MNLYVKKLPLINYSNVLINIKSGMYILNIFKIYFTFMYKIFLIIETKPIIYFIDFNN